MQWINRKPAVLVETTGELAGSLIMDLLFWKKAGLDL
jgi:hypothetical protein